MRIDADDVAILDPRDGAAMRGFRRDVNGGGHLARRAGHAPIGDQRYLVAAIQQHTQRGGKIVQFRHAVSAGALEPNHGDEIAIQFAALERGDQLFLFVKHDRRRFDQRDGPA